MYNESQFNQNGKGFKLRIGVLINAVYSDYGASIIEGISRYCRENNCSLIVFPMIRETQGGRYNFQYDAMLKLINPNNIFFIF